MSNKKLTQLPEKLTSLDSNDLLYVSASGVSKSIKASTLEAPLKTYADTKASEAQSAAISAANSSAQSLVNAEAARATSAESGLQNQITAEISNRIAADSSVQASISVESSRAVAAESSLQNQISSLDSRIDALELDSISKTYVDGEVSDLQSQIDSILGNIDPAALDSLTEVVAAFQSADSSLLGSITNLSTNLSNSILSESSARIAADAVTLQSAKNYTDSSISDALSNSSGLPVGAISMYAGTVAPSGYLLCDGSAVSRSTYSALFAVIGTTYGTGNGSTTFNLPNPDSNANIRLIIKI